MSRLLLILAATGALLGQDALRQIVHGRCVSYEVNGVNYPQSYPCMGALEVTVPAPADRRTGAPTTLTIKSTNAEAPVVTLTLASAANASNRSNERIEFQVKSISGAALALTPADKFTCLHTRGPLTALSPVAELDCAVSRPGLFRFRFFPNTNTFAYQQSSVAMYEALTGQPFSTLPANAAPPAPAGPPSSDAPAAPIQVSSDPKAIFGLLAGTRMPTLPFCRDNSEVLMDARVPLCRSRAGSELAAFFGALKEEFTPADWDKMGLATLTVFVNPQIYDTKVSDNVILLVDRAGIIQRMRFSTRLVADGHVLSVLTNKYGPPHRQAATTWTNRQTGAVLSRTPNYFWNFSNLSVDYFTRDTNLLNSASPLGGIYIHTPVFSAIVAGYQKRRGAPPVQRPPVRYHFATTCHAGFAHGVCEPSRTPPNPFVPTFHQ